MKTAVLVGIGMGNPENLTIDAKNAISQAKFVVGASRILNSVKEFIKYDFFEGYESEKILEKLSKDNISDFCCVFSGDTGFYSGALKLGETLRTSGWNVKLLPGITSAQYFAARLGKSWQDWNLVSAHGKDCNLGAEIASAQHTFFLTGGKITVQTVYDFLKNCGFEGKMFIGENLSSGDEKIIEISFDGKNTSFFDHEILDSKKILSVVLVENFRFIEMTHAAGALSDDVFIRNTSQCKEFCEKSQESSEKTVPMTKQIVRSAIISLLSPEDGEVFWDVGAGTGAVSIDLARCCKCSVIAVEEKTNAVELEKLNRRKFGCYNLEIINGRAPKALENLSSPDGVFIGGSEGELEEILNVAKEKNPAAKIVISAVTLETLSKAVEIAEKKSWPVEVTQLSVSKSRKLGKFNLMQSENPVFLIKICAC